MDKNSPDDFGEQNEEPIITASRKRKFPLFNLTTFNSFKNPVFRLYYVAMLTQRTARNMRIITRSYLIYHLTGSTTLLGSLALAFAIPMVITSLFGGAIADRVQKKSILVISQAASAATSLVIALSLTMGYLTSDSAWWILMATTALGGAFSGFMMPARQAIVPEIVGTQNISNAIALDSLSTNSLRLFAPALAGFLIDAYGFHVVYYSVTALSIISTILVAFMPLTGKVIKGGKNVLANIKEGLRYVGRKKDILFILAFVLLAMLLTRPIQTLMPVFVDEDHLNVSAIGMGILMGVSGAGAIVGSIIIASLPNKNRGLLLLAGGLIVGAALIGFSFSSYWYLSIALMAIMGLGQTIRMALGNTLVQYYVDDEYRGRVMSLYTMEFAFSSLGTFVAGALSDIVDAKWVVSSFAVILILITISVAVFVPRVRRLD
ncbi:MFS transporter [Chloroflexota bacterium]